MQHAFISYVRENEEVVDRLCHDLTSRGIHVWLDRNRINPGVRWKQAIRKAIQEGASFIACFSKEYNDRDRTYMNEELTLATGVLRQQHHISDKPWFIPVKLNECEIPEHRTGIGQYEEAKKDYEKAKQLADPDAYVLIYKVEKSLDKINTRLEQKQKSKEN